MKIDRKKLLISIAIPLAVGALAGLLTKDAMAIFAALKQPPLSPPGIVFPIVWTILYILMGISSYLLETSDGDPTAIDGAMNIYYYQLVVNFLWSIFFFNFGWYLFSLLWLILLWVLVFVMIKQFYKISKLAAYINIPYLLWLTFALYLNAGIWWLNR